MNLEKMSQIIVSRLSSPTTHELLIDEYILKYLLTVFRTADYGNKDILSIIIKIVAPILHNLRLTSSKDEAGEVIGDIFGQITKEMPQLISGTQWASFKLPKSAAKQLHEYELNTTRYK